VISPEWIGLLVQIPIVGIFAWFVIYRDRQYQDAQRERDEQWQKYIASMQQDTRAAIHEVTEAVRANNRSLDDLSKRLSELAGAETVARELATQFWGRYATKG
jgi:hypothetical protein